MKKEMVENYAQSLVKHGLYSTISKARKEANRWYKKHINGFEEPLLCPHHPDIETTVTHTENGGMIVEYKLPKN